MDLLRKISVLNSRPDLTTRWMKCPLFPIEIHIASDPNWDTYQRFKADNKES